jgi:acetolactate decarboxylase
MIVILADGEDAAFGIIDDPFAQLLFGDFQHVRIGQAELSAAAVPDALAADQTFFDLENVEGSMVGVYCPPYMTSLNSAGWHFHFVTADRKQGGHVLDCQVGKATASIDLTKEFDLALPGSEKFESTDFTVDRSADVKKAETNE